MDWLRQAAGWLRELLSQQAWLGGAQFNIAQTPDWALLATGPAILLLGVLVLRPIWPKPSRSAAVTEPASQQSSQANPALSTAAAAPSPKAAPQASRPAPTQFAVAPAASPAFTPTFGDEQDNRSVRVFVSSTFLDMQAERDELVTKTFPALRAKYRARGVEVFEVDLRWGIIREQQERGETLPTLLAEIDRCRPYFIGLLGDRYGWVPPASALTDKLKADYPALAEAEGASVTAMEIMHGVLANPDTAARALFFERDANWDWRGKLADADRVIASEEPEAARARLADLKAMIRQKARVELYARPAEIGEKVTAALGALLEERFPDTNAPDAFEQTARLHRAYARERRRLHVGADGYITELNRWMATKDAEPKLITGASGGGKSTLVANWVHAWRLAHPNDIVFEHYLGASPDSAEPMLLMRRLWEHLNRAMGESAEPVGDNADLMDMSAALAQRLAPARVTAERSGARVLIALDGLDKLASEQNLRWLPIVPGVHWLASSLPGEAQTAALARGFGSLDVKPLSERERRDFIAGTLARWRRELEPQHVARILQPAAAALAGSPLYLKTVLEELRVSADNARLAERLDDYRGARDMPDLFDRVLKRLEDDCEPGLVAKALPLIWASRGGLEESEILAITSAAPIAWATLRNGLGDGLRDQVGRIAFSHDFLRQAVERRYLGDAASRRAPHVMLSERYLSEFKAAARAMTTEQEIDLYSRTADERLVFLRGPWKRCNTELLFQLERAGRWGELIRCLTDEVEFNALPPNAYGSDWDHGPIIADHDALRPSGLLGIDPKERTRIALAVGQAFADQARRLKQRAETFPKSGWGEALGMPTWAETAKALRRDDPQRFGFFRDAFYSFKRVALLAYEWAVTAWNDTAAAKNALGVFSRANADISSLLWLLNEHGREVTGLSGAIEDNPSSWAWDLFNALTASESTHSSSSHSVDLTEVVQHITRSRVSSGRSLIVDLPPSAVISGQRQLLVDMLLRAIEFVAQHASESSPICIGVVHNDRKLQATVSAGQSEPIGSHAPTWDYNMFLCKLMAKVHGLDIGVDEGEKRLQVVFESDSSNARSKGR